MPDWSDVLKEIQQTIAIHAGQAQLQNQAAQGAIDAIRRKYLQALRDNSGRNVIAYYSGFLSKPDAPMLGITDEDKNGFMMAVHHCFMHSLMNTPAFKMIENHKGSAFVKQQVVQQIVMQGTPKN